MSSLVTITVILSLLLTKPNPSLASGRDETYVRNACSVTRYRQLCVQSLSQFSAVAKKSPSIWARAGVAVTITQTKHVLRLIAETRRRRRRRSAADLGKRDRVALSDCMELFVDALDELHLSLGVLRKLRESEFEEQMSDLATWLSAALTDQDTCLDGFEGTRSPTVRILRRRVVKAMYFTSNALALVNKLATAGLYGFVEP